MKKWRKLSGTSPGVRGMPSKVIIVLLVLNFLTFFNLDFTELTYDYGDEEKMFDSSGEYEILWRYFYSLLIPILEINNARKEAIDLRLLDDLIPFSANSSIEGFLTRLLVAQCILHRKLTDF